MIKHNEKHFSILIQETIIFSYIQLEFLFNIKELFIIYQTNHFLYIGQKFKTKEDMKYELKDQTVLIVSQY